jgi:hypothetical protein
MLKFRLDKRLVVDSTLFGVLLTLFIVAADLLGLLNPLELWLYDQRALRCQHWTPPPTDKLVHVDIDDAALESIGRWPWHRTVVADIIDEINLAKPKAVALDVLFSEPQDDEWRRLPNKQFVEIKHDKNLADALRRLDLSLLGASLPFVRETVSPVYADVRRILGQNPMLDEAHVAATLRTRGTRLPNLDDLVRQDFYLARGEAIFERIELAGDELPPKD